MTALIDRLVAREPVTAPVLVLVAHPDDETLALSVALPHLSDLTLVHATISSDAEETALRHEELGEALQRLGCNPRALVAAGYPDGSLVDHAAALAEQLVPLMHGVVLCVTHAFEGGHPDHDACSLAVALAARRLGGNAPALAEFPIYSLSQGRIRTTRFADGEGIVFALSPQEAACKRHALAAFASQRHVVDRFPLDVEALRPSVAHNHAAPRSADQVLFARGSAEPGRQWREAALRQQSV